MTPSDFTGARVLHMNKDDWIFLSGAMANISDVLPLWHATSAIREPWLNGDGVVGHVAALGLWFAAAMVAIFILLRRRDARA